MVWGRARPWPSSLPAARAGRFLRVLQASPAAPRGQLRRLEAPGRLPQPLQVVILARLLGEDVDHEVHVIKQHPLRLLVALDVGGMQAYLIQALLHFVRNGLNLDRKSVV